MKVIIITMTIVSLCLLCGTINAQNYLNGPECADFDELNNRYIISSWANGALVAMDTAGNQNMFFDFPGTVLGNVIKDSLIYFSNGRSILCFNLNTTTPVFTLFIPESRQMDGMTVDSSGMLYVVDWQDGAAVPAQLFKIDLSDNTYSIFASSTNGLALRLQDVIYDHDNNRLLVVGFTPNAPIQAVSLADSSVSDMVVTPFGDMDGIAMDNEGYTYYTCFSDGCVYRYDSNFTNPPLTFATGLDHPSNLDYNLRDSILAVPAFNGNYVAFFPDVYKIDSDDDGYPDAYDDCPNTPNVPGSDVDSDGIGDACDNCPNNYNPGQEDEDEDNIGDVCEYICGDANYDQSINVSDAVWIINFVFSGGAAPDPIESGDCDCSGSCNVSDAVYIINFVFSGGNLPCDTDGDDQPDC